MFGLVNSLRTRTTQRERGFSLSLGEGILVFIVAGLVIALGYKLFRESAWLGIHHYLCFW